MISLFVKTPTTLSILIFSFLITLTPSLKATTLPFMSLSVPPTVFTISPGRVLFTQVVPPKDSEAITFLFLPGINRSVLLEEEAIKILISKGYGVVTFNFSTQPLSVALLDRDVRPYFLDNELALKDFAEETEILAKSLRKNYGMKKIIPVSLSYSGAVSIFLKDFPVVIDTSPMTSNAAAHPQADILRKSVMASQFFNPFFGPVIVRSTLDSFYRAHWEVQVASITDQFGISKIPAMVEGYTMMSRAAEDFSWLDAGVDVQGKRIYLIAENEAATLKENQLTTFKELDPKGSVILFKDSGHIIPFDQPELYAETLIKVALEAFSE